MVPRLSEDPMAETRLIQDIHRTYDKDGHPHIVQVFCTYEAVDVHVIVMEAMHDDAFNFMNDLLQSGRTMSDELMIDLFEQWALAIKCCHDQSIAHLDPSLENFLLKRTYDSKTSSSHMRQITGFHADITAKLTDFGLARHVRSPTTVIDPFHGGKITYMSPQRNDFHPFMPLKDDIFSLGMCFLVMMTGYKLFEKCSFENIRYMKYWATGNALQDPFVTRLLMRPETTLAQQRVLRLVQRMIVIDERKRPTIDQVLADPLFSREQPASKSCSIGSDTSEVSTC
jgi:serine/threonine protein kinase